MNVTCPNCATLYRVDPAKVPQAGVRARCAVCSAVFAVSREGRESTPPAVAVAPPAAAPAAAAPASQPPPPAPVASPLAPPAPTAKPAAPPAAAPMSRPVAPPASPRPVMPPSFAGNPGTAPRPAAPMRPQAPATPPAVQAPPVVQTPPVVQAPPPTPAPVATTAPATPSRPPAPPTGPGGRPANPFLSQAPSLTARRLARALVSDIVVYHPAKRQEGIRDGNLKELFQEEIKKSWEEYTDQVGREVAESTGFFREALNEILAGGRQIF